VLHVGATSLTIALAEEGLPFRRFGRWAEVAAALVEE
jgi:hypothetical protein